MRVVVVTRIPQIFIGFHATLADLGHDVVALLTSRDGPFTADLLGVVPDGIDVVMPAKRRTMAALLAPFAPDLVVCMGFPWKIPADALAVPALGWLNGHPGLLPDHRGPVPVAWAIRHGDAELGMTFHFMDAELDTGPIVAQQTMEIGDYAEPDEFYARMGAVVGATLREAIEKIVAGERGAPQPAGAGRYETFFTEDDVRLDLSRPAAELHRLVWAWRYTIPVGTERGALLDDERVLATSLEPVDGARRIECGDGPLWIVRSEPADPPTE